MPERQEVSPMNPPITFSAQKCIIRLTIQQCPGAAEFTGHQPTTPIAGNSLLPASAHLQLGALKKTQIKRLMGRAIYIGMSLWRLTLTCTSCGSMNTVPKFQHDSLATTQQKGHFLASFLQAPSSGIFKLLHYKLITQALLSHTLSNSMVITSSSIKIVGYH